MPPGRSRTGPVAAVLALVLAAGIVVVLGDGRPHRSAAAPVVAASTRSAPAPVPDAGTFVPVALGRSVPVLLRIPALGLSARLGRLGLRPDGTVEVPADFRQPGWFELGPAPGQTGSAVILGHVDSYRGPAVFFRLRELAAGDRIEVGRADGSVARFTVRTVATYPKEDFPARQVYGAHGGSALNLVTCGGAFDRRTRSYLSNVVVHAVLDPGPARRRTPAAGSGTAG